METEFLEDISKNNQLVRVAKMYYEMDISQEEISVLENTSKATVSRLLQRAKTMGIVKFTINYPIESVNILEEKIKAKFNVKAVFVSPVYVDDYRLILEDACKSLAGDLSRLIREGDVIGISWGRTMEALSRNLVPPLNNKDVKIVQLNGSVATNINSTRFSTVLVNFSNKFNGDAFQLPVPLIVDSEEIKLCLLTDSQIKMVMEMGEAARIVVFSIGRLSKDSVLFESGSITEDYYEILKKNNAVGDICGHYFDKDGKQVITGLEKRTIGITLEGLSKKEHRIAIAAGSDKALSIAAALRGGYITSLYTDEYTARALLDL